METASRFARNIRWGERTYVMGILNASPDSFSGDGLGADQADLEAGVEQARRFVSDGADVIDIGGQSTRPGSSPVPTEIELNRVIPLLRAVRKAVDVPISIDSFRYDVVKAALEAGADWINDVWGLRMDGRIAYLAAQYRCTLVIMHNRSRPRNEHERSLLTGVPTGSVYDDLIEDVKRELLVGVQRADEAGVEGSKIILDPGIGFGKSVAQNVQLIRDLGQLKALGYPILVGPSRKSFIGRVLELPENERVEGTGAAVAIAIDRGADVVRVHDVRSIARVAKMTDRIVRA